MQQTEIAWLLDLIASTIKEAVGAKEVQATVWMERGETEGNLNSSSSAEKRIFAWLSVNPEAENRLRDGAIVAVPSELRSSPDVETRMLLPLRGRTRLEGFVDIRFAVPPNEKTVAQLQRWCDLGGPVLASLRECAWERETVALGLHQLVTPLVAARGFTKMLLEKQAGTINEMQKEFLTTILENVERMVQTVGKLRTTANA